MGAIPNGTSAGRGARIVIVVVALLVAVLGWLAWRHVADAGPMPWVLGAVAFALVLFGLLAPLRWVRTALGMNLFTQDAFKD